ncbi:hypothetical protein CDG81_21210 [Actinopolyspora erythraea]|uniref:Uncharacterized protein n=1 Tax=Actinopolyspora erythraea TaxID=414996 RepID=A0A099D959_9ACTN|nr:hypothetical protein [Actinopolyspora erythraea]ASU80369.1 hypothetical protein CDG81_21210 [Actinopolyspora erythraea]KGI82549.1 hypothetical protein IL38_03670 [Actinopolyspora erythraea]
MDGALSAGWDGWVAVPAELAQDNSMSLQARAAFTLIQTKGRLRLSDLASAGATDPIELVAELERYGWLTGSSVETGVQWTLHARAVAPAERTALAREATAPVGRPPASREAEAPREAERSSGARGGSGNTMSSESLVRQWAEQQKNPIPDRILKQLAEEIRAKREMSPLANTGDLVAALNIWLGKKTSPSRFSECYGEALQRSARDVYDGSSSSQEVAKEPETRSPRPRHLSLPESKEKATGASTRPLPGHCGNAGCDNGYIEQDDGRVRKCPDCLPEPSFGRRAFDLPRQAHYVAAQNKRRMRERVEHDRSEDVSVVDIDGPSDEEEA